jgi:phosphoribosylaminoimidazolecarboxamide formyltransferase/IMP cyclohydrolase
MKALISVYNKDIVVEFARALNELGLEIIATEGTSSENTLDNMDLGGVAMLRSGIKNFEQVSVIVNPARYTGIIDELRVSGQIARGTRLRLAQEASKYIVAYESKINALLERME